MTEPLYKDRPARDRANKSPAGLAPTRAGGKPPFIGLSIDGGGIRGLYSAEVLSSLGKRFGIREDRLHKRFDLIAGTSTGGILAAAMSAGEPPSRLAALYREKGAEIFSGAQLPKGTLGRFLWLLRHLNQAVHGNDTLRLALTEIFGKETLESLHDRHGTALCITAVNTLDNTPRVFKTPHLGDFDRDNQMTVVDACMATSAAPLFLPLHRTSGRSGAAPCVYADGGLWMNNPAPVALLEALKMADIDQEILILSIGNPTPASGCNPSKIRLNRGLAGWKVGLGPLELSMDAQSKAAHHFCQKLIEELRRLGRKVSLVRPVIQPVSAQHSADLSLDNASPCALELLSMLAEADATEAYRRVQAGDPEGILLRNIFTETNEHAHARLQ